jgi:hypothetical protein|tara:strand:+ start:120 stop:719 length:600 start_codon:yes stop_codon:yes gene_type:complete
MKKKVRIFENEIKRATRRKLMENYLDEQHEMRDTYSRADYKSSPREQGVRDVFGKYGEEIPPSVLRYMRKNPAAIIKRLHKLYGNEIFDAVKGSGEEFMSVDAQSGKYGPYDRDNDGISSSVDQDDDGDGMLDLNVDVMSEEEMMSVYDDPSNLTSDLETDKVKRGQTVGVKDNKGTVRTITVNESTRRLLKKYLNNRK